MTNTIKLKRGSGSDPSASDMVVGEPVLRSDTAELFFKRDDGSVAKVSGGNNVNFEYLELRNAANNGAASYPNADFTLVTSGTTTAIQPAAANTVLVSVNGVIQKPNTGTSTPSAGFALNGSTIKFGGNLSAAPDFILYQEAGGIGEPSDETVSEAKLKVSNNPVNGYVLTAQSGNTGGLTWAAASGGGSWNLISTTTVSSDVASVDFTSIGSYNRYVLLWDRITDGAQGTLIQIYDNGSLVTSSDYVFQRSRMSSGGATFDTTFSGFLFTNGMIGQIGRFDISVAAPRASMQMMCGGLLGTNDSCNQMFTTGGMKSTYSITDITGFRVTTTSGTAEIESGRFSLYGIGQ